MGDEQMYLEIILDAKARMQELDKVKINFQEIKKQVEMAKRTFAEFAGQMIQKSKEIVTKGFEKIKQSAIDLANSINKTFKSIDQGFTRIVAVTSLIGGLFISLSSDASEMNNKFNVVFGELGQEVDNWADGYGKAINRSKNTIKGMLTENQDLFVGMGMTRDKAKEFSKAVVTLTNDLASFNNLDTKRASELMMSSLMGESQAARSLGANILETQLNVTALQMGYKGYSDKMDEVTKMTIRYNTILRQNGDALGDSIRTSNDWANASRGVIDNLKELAATITAYALPSLAETASGILQVIYNVKDYVINNKELMIALVNSSIGFLKFIGVVFLVVKALVMLTSPMFYAIVALGLLYVAWETNFFGIRDLMKGIVDFVTEHPIISGLLGLTALGIKKLVFEYEFVLLGKTLAALLNGALLGAGLTIGEIFTSAGIGALAGFVIGAKISIISGGAKDFNDYVKKTMEGIALAIESWKDDKNLVKEAFITALVEGLTGALKYLFSKPLSWFGIDSTSFFKKMGEVKTDATDMWGNKYSDVSKLPWDTGKKAKKYTGGLVGYDSGGYTGDGGKYDIAGVVHRGEYVIPKHLVSKNKDTIAYLESQRVRGFSGGGGDLTIGQFREDEQKNTGTTTRKIANKAIGIIQAGGLDKDGVDKITKAIEGLTGVIESFNLSVSGLNKEVAEKIGEMEAYKSEIMGAPEGGNGNTVGKKDKNGKEIYDFVKEQDKFFKELEGLGIKKPDLKYFEEYQQFLESSLKKMIDDDIDTTEIASKIKENKASLENAKKTKEDEDLLKKQAEEFKNLIQKALETAIGNALETGNLIEFKTSLGDGAYETLKKNMIKAFSESKVYQDMFAEWFKTDDIKFTGNFEEDFKLMQERLEKFKENLNVNGLMVGARKTAEELKGIIQTSLETAVNNAFTNKNLKDFKTSLGESAYESLKDNMIKAFSESKIYQDMFAKWFKTDDIKFTGNFEEGFKLMQERLNEFKEKANSEGANIGSKEEEQKLKEEKEKFKSQLSEFSNALSSVATQLNNDFIDALSSSVNGVLAFMNALATYQLGGTLNTMTGALGMAGAVVGVIQGITSTLDNKRDKKNDAQLNIYEENTKALEELGNKMENMTSKFSDVADSIIQNLSANPTLARTAQSSSTLSNMLNIIDANKKFGKISFVADYRKERFMRSASHRKETFTFGDNIDNYSYEQLKSYREQLNKINNNTFAAIANGKDITWDSSDWGDFLLGGALGGTLGGIFGGGDYNFNGIDSSNLAQYKANIDNYLKAYEKIMQEQKEIMKTSTLESFEGIEKLAEDDLREQYEEMFKDMGLDPAKYKKDIEEMVKANSILITATDDVRSAWISAVAKGKNTGEALFTGLESYFSKMINNIASVLYDVDMSNFDANATVYFEKFSNVLVDAKINGKDIGTVMKEFLKGSDTNNFINEILNVKEANKNIEDISKTLREELKKAGLTDEDIDNLGIIDSTRQKFLDIVEDVKNALKTAIGKGLESGSLLDFRKSLGDSIYSSAKDALITAFSESAVYKEMFAKWFEVSNVNFTGNLDEDFATMNELLYQLRAKLRQNEMDSTADDGSETSSSTTSSSYYTGTTSSNSSNGTSVVEYHYHFDFANANVYNESELKEVIIETIKDTKKV